MKSDRRYLLLPGTSVSYLVIIITIFINVSALLTYSAGNEKCLTGNKNLMSEEVLEDNNTEEENIKIDWGDAYDKSCAYHQDSEFPFYQPIKRYLLIEIFDPPPERVS